MAAGIRPQAILKSSGVCQALWLLYYYLVLGAFGTSCLVPTLYHIATMSESRVLWGCLPIMGELKSSAATSIGIHAGDPVRHNALEQVLRRWVHRRVKHRVQREKIHCPLESECRVQTLISPEASSLTESGVAICQFLSSG
ncbi:hypothetical protein C8R47DRAFT_421858 [Mycena vitilis]|nr:hypothetical protein C8R47DRAFT_421858 [Mycena vitilis]